MHEDPQRRPVKLADLDEVPWLQVRLQSVDPVHDRDRRLALGRSMVRPKRTNGTFDFDPTGAAYAFDKDSLNIIKATDLSVGQIQPIRVFRYPPGCDVSSKPYGIICGYRRVKAARELNKHSIAEGKPAPLPELEAIVYILSKEEYDSRECRLLLRLIAVAENCQRQEMHPADRINIIADICEEYCHLHPEARRPGRRTPQSPHRGADTFVANLTGLSRPQIRAAVNIKKRLAVKVFAKWHQGTLGLGSVRALLPIPQHAQVRIVETLERANKPVTEQAIREEIAKHAKLRPLLSKRALPESSLLAEPPAGAPAPATAVPAASPPLSEGPATLAPERRIDCKGCSPCQYVSEDPTRCPVFARMLVAIDVTTRVCLNLTLDMKHSPETIAALKQRVTSLVNAATALHQFLAHPESLPRLEPASLPAHSGKAA